MSSSFDKFAPKATTNHRNDIMKLLKDTFLVGVEEFAKTIGGLVNAPDNAGKHQISLELEQREHTLQESRTASF